MALYDELEAAYKVLADKFKELTADGKFSMMDAFTVFLRGQLELAALVAKYSDVPRAEKQRILTDVGRRFYDEVIAPINIKAIPDFVEGVFDNMLRDTIVVFIPGILDGVLDFVDSHGILFDNESVAPVGPLLVDGLNKSKS